MVTDRLIGAVAGAAEQLGMADGVTAVRVRRTNPPAAERRLRRAGEPVRERIATPQSLLAILRAKAKELPIPKAAAAVSAPASPAIASATGKAGEDRFIVEGPGTKMPAPKAEPGPTAKPATPTEKPDADAGKCLGRGGAFGTV